MGVGLSMGSLLAAMFLGVRDGGDSLQVRVEMGGDLCFSKLPSDSSPLRTEVMFSLHQFLLSQL